MPFSLPTAEEKPVYVRGMFDRISGAYDRVNDLMTAGRHRAWKRTVIELARVKPGSRCLDVCTGTGDLAFLHARASAPGGEVTALDFSSGMLDKAQERPWDGPAIRWMQGDAMALPFEDDSFDAYTVGFGLRNVSDLDQALKEAKRVLKPGGRFVSLDLGKPKARIVRWGSELYEFRIVPFLGGAVSGEPDAYKYLPHSNRTFPDQRTFAERLQALGFQDVQVHDRFMGAIAMVSATAP